MDDKKLFAPKGKNITTVNRAFRCISGHVFPTSCGVFTNGKLVSTKLIPNISQSRKFHQKYKFQLLYNLQHIFNKDSLCPNI